MLVVSPQSPIMAVSLDQKELFDTASCKPSGSRSTSVHRVYIDLQPAFPAAKLLIVNLAGAVTTRDTGRSTSLGVNVRSCTGKAARKRGWEQLKLQYLYPAKATVGADRYRIYAVWPKAGQATVIILKIPDTAAFMASIHNETPLGDLTLPGTHESCALYGYPISQCQQPATPLRQQLMDGIRYFDVRIRVVGDELLTYHGPRPQRSSLPIILQTITDFLTAYPSETLIVCLKEETPPNHPLFARKVYEAFQPFLSGWFLENRIPSLGEVRGKAILLSRFGNGSDEKIWMEGLGIHPYMWPDSRKEGFEWDCAGTKFRIQDWYRVTTFVEIPEKFEAVTNHLTPTLDPAPPGAPHPFTLSYTSASYFPLSFPTVIAKGFGWPRWGLGVYGVNSRFCGWALEQIAQGKRIRGCIPMDFYRQASGGADEEDETGLADILISMNFMGSSSAAETV